MSKHQSNKNASRRGKPFSYGTRHGETPRWSNGKLLNPASGRSNDRSDRSHRPHGSNGVATREAVPTKPAVGKYIMQHHTHGRRHPVLVLTKREASKGFPVSFSARFEPTKKRNDERKGSDFIAKLKVHGRPVFLDRASPKPTDPRREYGFELVGENGSATVYFARIVLPEDIVKPTSITIDVKTGKMVANNARLPKLSKFKSKKPIEQVALPVSDEHDDLDDLFGRWDDFDFGYTGSYSSFACTSDCDEDDCTCGDAEPESYFEVELAEKERLRPMNATWCHNCGCRICECDGTPQVDAQPYLMPAHLTQVRFPARVPTRKPRTPRYAWR